MNIFACDSDPRLSAQAHDDVRCNKMTIESAQLLATSLLKAGVPQSDVPYKATHTMHPCSLWALRSRGNFLWLVELGLELASEYTFRYDRTHKTQAVIEHLWTLRDAIPKGSLTWDFNSSGFRAEPDLFHAYRLCLVAKWRFLDGYKSARSRKPSWTDRDPPVWKRQLWAAPFEQLRL